MPSAKKMPKEASTADSDDGFGQHEQELFFAPRFLEQYTGRAVLHDPITAIVELVANAWDAGSSRVDIDWPTAAGDPLRVSDNGCGMTEEQFQRRWRTLSYDRIAEQGATVHVTDRPDLQPRPVFGKNGLGRFAAFCFSSEYTVITATGGKEVTYRVRRGLEQPIKVEKLSEQATARIGTTIEAVQNGGIPLSAEVVRSELGKRFLTDPAFEVIVNSIRVDFEDLSQHGVEDIKVSIPGLGTVRILMIDAQRTDRTTKQHGVAWHVNGRLVGNCDWRGNGFDDLVDGRRIEARRYTFIIFADCLGGTGAVKPDWSSFNDDDPSYQRVREHVVPKLREVILELTKERRAETTNAVRRANADKLRQMTPLSREKWNEFIERVQETCPSLSQGELHSLSGLLANLEIAHSRFGLLSKLHELDSNQLDELHSILEEWSVDMAKVVLDELKVRLKLVDVLHAKTSTTETLEVQELQPLFHRGLWIFGPEFETIEFTSNVGMTTVIQTLFGREDLKGSRNRPDFAVLPDSSVGLYSYPRYDDHGGEIGVDRLVIIELKKPGVVIGDEEKSQSWKYVKELYVKGLLLDGTRVDCYVLGSQIDQNESGARTERNERVRIQPLSFDTVLARAKSRLLKLYDRVKAAPFLQGKNMDKFFNGIVVPEDELLLDEDVPHSKCLAPAEQLVAAVNEENVVEDSESKPSGHSL